MNIEQIKHTIGIYQKILKHLQHHLDEGNFDNLDIKQSKMLKNEIKKLNNLIIKKGAGIQKYIQLEAFEIPHTDILYQYSNPEIAQKRAFKYLGKDAILYKSFKKNKKYMIYNPNKNHFIHFGQIPYEDYTKHQNTERRRRYLKRTENMRGDWINDPYSPNNLSRNILW